MRELSLFTGAGGGLLGSKLLGWKTLGYVEIDDYCQRVIAQRIRDGILDNAPIFGDIRTFLSERYAEAYQGMVDVITGGFPCQDISVCKKNATGIEGERSGLWMEMAEVIRQIGPVFILLENSPALTSRGFGRVLRDLALMGYDARWGVFRASAYGAAHHRARLFLVAYAHGASLESMDFQKSLCFDPAQSRRRQFTRAINASLSADDYATMSRNPNDLARGMDRLKATGNGQVPDVVEGAWKILTS